MAAADGATPAAQVRRAAPGKAHPPRSVAAMTDVTGVRESALQSVLSNAEPEPKAPARKQRRDAPAGWRRELKREENVDWIGSCSPGFWWGWGLVCCFFSR